MPKNSASPRRSASVRLRRIEPAEDVQLRRRREVEEVLELAHEMHLAAALERVDALARGAGMVAVEVGGALLELREVLDALERALRSEQTLHADAAQRRRVDAVAELVGPDVADGVRGGVGVAVGVAVEAGDALMRLQAAPVLGQVELLLRKRRDQQPQALELLRIENVLEQPLEVVERDELALRDVAEVGPRHQEDCRGEFGKEVIGQIEVEVESREVAAGLLHRLVDERLREDHPARFVVRVRQRQEAGRPGVLAFLISSGVIAASCSHVMFAGSLTRTPSCTALPRVIVTPGAGRFARS